VHFYSKILGKTRSNVATLTHLGAASRRPASRHAGPPRRPCPAPPEASSAPRDLEVLPSSRRAPAGRTASNGPPVASVPHGRTSYRGRRPPLGMPPSTLRSQASGRVTLKGSRCSSLARRTPLPAAPSCRHWPCPCRPAPRHRRCRVHVPPVVATT
jgi:hypothetical protein